MGKITGFLEIERSDRRYVPVDDRIRNYNEFMTPAFRGRDQGSGGALHGLRHSVLPRPARRPAVRSTIKFRIGTISSTAPIGRRPRAIFIRTNNFPEFTGRLCPAPCEASCTLNIDDSPVTIKTIECAIADRAWTNGWIKPEPPRGQDRQEDRGGWLGTGGPGLRAAASEGRARRPSLREKRQTRRSAALWHSRLQDGKASR